MRLLYISNIRIPTAKAHGHQIMKMCQFFASNQVAVELVCPTRKNLEFKDIDPFNHYQIKKNFIFKKIFAYDPKFLLKVRAGVYIKVQSFLFMISLFFFLLFKQRKKEYFFYTRDEYLLPLLALFSSRVIWEGHSLPRRRKYYQPYFIRAHRILVLTSELKKMLISNGVSAEKILVSPDAVDLELFGVQLDKKIVRQELHLPMNRIILGYTGSFKTKNMDKGIADILKSLVLLKKKYPSILFVAVGGTVEHIREYLGQAKALAIQDVALFLPTVDQKILAKYNQAFDIALMPFPFSEHYAYFMSPLKMFEYMASLRPIVASDLPSIREVLNEDNAVIVLPDNSENLAQGIDKLIIDQTLAIKLAAAAYDDARKYTWQKRVEKIINFITV